MAFSPSSLSDARSSAICAVANGRREFAKAAAAENTSEVGVARSRLWLVAPPLCLVALGKRVFEGLDGAVVVPAKIAPLREGDLPLVKEGGACAMWAI